MYSNVYIHSASTTRVTNKPDKGFYDLCLEAGEAVLADVPPRTIDSVYVASMDPALYGVTGEIAASIASDLGLLPRETLGIRGTSSAGGIGLIPAFKDIVTGLHDKALLISCEQMNRVVSGRKQPEISKKEERARLSRLLEGVIVPDERTYGLSMILIGDMIERALLHYLGLTRENFLRFIPDLTMAMYERAALYPHAHFSGNVKTLDDYEKSPWVSRHYRRDDVVPPSTAASAILLSSKPPANPLNNRVVRFRGIGQGVTHPALTRRSGPVTASLSIRRAIFELARGADLSLETLRAADVGFPHDAFPSISRMILKELGFSHDESLAGLMSGRFNPCGGLVKCGHPVGCSGELQLVRAFQQMTRDERAIPAAIQRSPCDRAFTVSVGAALTNIVATYLTAHDGSHVEGGRGRSGPGFDGKVFRDYLNLAGLHDRYESARKTIPEDAAVLLTSTRSALGWINLVQSRETKMLAIGDDELEPGALLAVAQPLGSLNRVARVLSERADDDLLVPLGIIPCERVECRLSD